MRFKEASLDYIRDNCTQLAIKHINSNTQLYNTFKNLKFSEMEKQAEWYSKQHDNKFGELFTAELPLIKWKAVKTSL